MKKIFYLSLFFIIILISCNIYVNDNIGILIFDEDSKGNRLTNETLTFILLKREDKNSFNNITYISGEIYNKNGNQNIKYIDNQGDIQYLDTVALDSENINVRKYAYNRALRYIMDNQDFTISVQELDQDLGSMIITIRGV